MKENKMVAFKIFTGPIWKELKENLRNTEEILIASYVVTKNAIEKVANVASSADIRILTSFPNFQKTPSFIEEEYKELMEDLGERLTIRHYSGPEKQFHPKVIILLKKDQNIAFVGSSNLTYPGLGIEHPNAEVNNFIYEKSEVEKLINWFNIKYEEAQNYIQLPNHIIDKLWWNEGISDRIYEEECGIKIGGEKSPLADTLPIFSNADHGYVTKEELIISKGPGGGHWQFSNLRQ